MNASVSLDYADLASLTPTGNRYSNGSYQLVNDDTDVFVKLTADEALNLSQVFAGLADELAARETVAA